MSSDSNGAQKGGDLKAQLARLGYGADAPVEPVPAPEELRRSLLKKREREGRAVAGRPIAFRRDLPRTVPRPSSGVGPPSDPVRLESTVEGRETAHRERGRFFAIQTPVFRIADAPRIAELLRDRLSGERSGVRHRLRQACGSADLGVDDVIFLDVESTGLGCSPLFLVGVMLWEGDGLTVKQYLARDYAEEAAVIASFAEDCLHKRLVVTFNGKSFDVPFLRARAAATGVRLEFRAAHIDLLHECRRVWKNVLPDCRLQTLESRVCGRTRRGDIAGAEIPDAYHAFVRTGDARRIVEILRHNALDLVTLAELMTRLPDADAGEDGRMVGQ
jgi:uncharacterized protein YprB with RNaseH-like and TPR domain